MLHEPTLGGIGWVPVWAVAWAPGAPGVCCNGNTFLWANAMGVAIYLALVGGALTMAVAASLVLRGVKLI